MRRAAHRPKVEEQIPVTHIMAIRAIRAATSTKQILRAYESVGLRERAQEVMNARVQVRGAFPDLGSFSTIGLVFGISDTEAHRIAHGKSS